MECILLLFFFPFVITKENMEIRFAKYQLVTHSSNQTEWNETILKVASKIVCTSMALKNNFELHYYNNTTKECLIGNMKNCIKGIHEGENGLSLYIKSDKWKETKCEQHSIEVKKEVIGINSTTENTNIAMEKDPKVLLLLSSKNPNFETGLDHYWDAITTKRKTCKIDPDLIPPPSRNGLRSGLAYGHGKLFLCMGTIYNTTFDPMEYQKNNLVGTYKDCLYFDLDEKYKEWKNLPNSSINTLGSQPQLAVDGDYLYCLTWDMTLGKKSGKNVKRVKNNIFRYNLKDKGEWEHIQTTKSNQWKPTEK